jgi:hypothetical protein
MFRSNNDAETKVTIRTESVKDSTIIGVMQGPSLDQVRDVFHQELADLKNLLVYGPNAIQQIDSSDRVAESLFACESNGASALGFAVNNSGLLICPSIGPISSVRHLSSGTVSDAEVIQSRNLLQAVKIKRNTGGLIPSYQWRDVTIGDKLFVFGAKGEKCTLTVTGLMMWIWVKRKDPLPAMILRDVFMADLTPPRDLIGGPVINSTNEVVGIAVASFGAGASIIIKPWSALEQCIEMQVEERKPST